MVTGSVASGLQGWPRATHDVDIVVQLTVGDAARLVKEFAQPRFYVSDVAVQEALANDTMFNLIDTHSGDKVDFWMLTDDPFDQSCFAGRRSEAVDGRTLFVPRPEDTILLKLRWAVQSGGSEKQFTDALGIFEVQGLSLDLAHIESWVDRLGVRQLWTRLLGEASSP
jgi:hypothetical protein